MAAREEEINLDKSGETEEIQLKICFVKEGQTEKDLTETLVEISNKHLEDDQKSMEWFIGTGWEEAVCGWGTVSPTACLQPQTKPKKRKPGGVPSCILCLEMCQLTDKNRTLETKTTTDASLTEISGAEHLLTHNGLPPAEDSPRDYTDHCSSATVVSKIETSCDKASSTDVFHGGQKQGKEKDSESCTSPLMMTEASPVLVIPNCASSCDTKDLRMSTSAVVLPPLKAAACNGHIDPPKRKNKDVLVHHLEKLPSKNFLGNHPNVQFINKTELRGERRHVEAMHDLPREELNVPNLVSFVTPCTPKTSLRDTELHWECSFLNHKTSTAIPSALTLKQSANPTSVGFLHTRVVQNKRNMRQDIRHLNEAKLRSRAKSGTTSLLTSPLLPPLTVTRVEIPVIHYRPL
ncbi:hypothetical protein FKM82_003629 [Ascaphus truei]